MAEKYRLGVDVGGTFTDVVLLEDDGTATPKKVLSSPPHFNVAIKTGIEQAWKRRNCQATKCPSTLMELLLPPMRSLLDLEPKLAS